MEKDYDRIVLVHEDVCPYQPVDCPDKIWEVCRDLRLTDSAEEYVYCFCMDSKQKIAGVHEVSHGNVWYAMMSPAEIFKRVLLNNARGFILVHNHPSGDCTPSSQDYEITDRIRKAAEIMGLKFYDHIIVGSEDYYSFLKEEGDF